MIYAGVPLRRAADAAAPRLHPGPGQAAFRGLGRATCLALLV